MCCEDFKPLSYMAKPSSWVPGRLTQVGEVDKSLFFETGTDCSPARPPSCEFLASAS